MIFTKPVSELTFEDISQLVSSAEPESIILDYKKEISGSDRDKGEVSKDISAFANSQGGYLVIGVEEREGKPVGPPCGTLRMLARQKTEEWIAQVANANISQRVHMDIKVIPFADAEDKCVVVIHVPTSPRMPHMVSYERDNRYYRRIFKRHQYESLPAEEYEVREMFERGQRMNDKLISYLASQGYTDPANETFAENVYTKLLGMVVRGRDIKHEVVQAEHFVSFVACPILESNIDNTGDELWSWLDPNARRYQPDPGGIYLPREKRTTLDGVILTENQSYSEDIKPRLLRSFLRITRNGYIEFGCTLAESYNGNIVFHYVPMIGMFWWFLEFALDVYKREAIHVPIRVILNMKGTKDSFLWNLADGWAEPFGEGREYRPNCIEPNIQIIEEIRTPFIEEIDKELFVRKIAGFVDNAWGQRDVRCFNNKTHDAQQRLPITKVRSFCT